MPWNTVVTVRPQLCISLRVWCLLFFLNFFVQMRPEQAVGAAADHLNRPWTCLQSANRPEVSEPEWQDAETGLGDSSLLFGGAEAESGDDHGSQVHQVESDLSDLSADEVLFDNQSPGTEGGSGSDHEEDDQQLDIVGKAVSGLLDKAEMPDSKVFRHRVSGIYHLMAVEDGFPEGEGELSSTKCGKIISHNFIDIASLNPFCVQVQAMFHTVTFCAFIDFLVSFFSGVGDLGFVSLSVVAAFIDVNSHMSLLSSLLSQPVAQP